MLRRLAFFDRLHSRFRGSKRETRFGGILSPKERVNHLAALERLTVQWLSKDWRKLLPFRGGEGWGEGGTHFQLNYYG
jgi:hypothetical protein